MVVVLVDMQGVTSSPRVFAYGQAIFKVFVCYIKKVVLCILTHTLEVLKLDAQHHVLGPGEQVNPVISKPKLSTQVPKAILIFSPGAVEIHTAVDSVLHNSPATTMGLHVTENLKGPISVIRGNLIDSILHFLHDTVV